MAYRLTDAHVHLTDRSLSNSLPEILATYDQIGLAHAVVVGSSPQDWPQVLELCANDKRFIPAVGLHPWQVNQAPADWQDSFLSSLDQGVRVIGEIGLDQWMEGHDIDAQRLAFEWQLAIAAERNLPTSIHCLKAHEPFMQTLRRADIPKRGFKLHAYNGPVDTIKPLLDLGAYFSFNAGQLKPNAKSIYQLIEQVPEDRLLIETDAPNFPLPAERQEFTLQREGLCHPGNIRVSYRAIAQLRGLRFEELSEKVAANFQRYFLA